MSEEGPFRSPKVTINRVYTKTGDGGSTRLVGGQLVGKADLRIEAYGTVDELNAFVGHCSVTAHERYHADPEGRIIRLEVSLRRVQHELFNLGSILATLPEDVHEKQPRVTDAEVEMLEQEMDFCQEELQPLKSFVLPGGSRLNVDLHVARTVCRRAERRCVELAVSDPKAIDAVSIRYLNRLSDALFVWSRYASLALGTFETLWNPNRAASAFVKLRET